MMKVRWSSLRLLLCETNAGSVRWFRAIETLPFESLEAREARDAARTPL